MTTAVLADNVKEKRDPARRKLEQLIDLVEQIDSTQRVLVQLRARRLSKWRELAELDPPVSWADMARVSGVRDVTIIQAVNGRKGL